MNIELIKSEIKRLSLIVDKWRDGVSVPAIEQDLALDRIKSLYNELRFGEAVADVAANEAVAAPAVAPVVAPAAEEPQSPETEEAEENEVEVEFIFAEDDDEAEEDNASAVVAESEPTPEPVAEPEVATPAEVATPVVEEKPVAPVVQAVEPEKKAAPVEEPKRESAKPRATVSVNSLFGAEEPRREPRSKHQRMMSIYDDTSREKVVDISKIFDMDDDETDFVTMPAPKAEPRAKRVVEVDEAMPMAPSLADAKTVTLADAMAQNTTTLADTIEAPTALGEEINNSHIRSLRRAIGINDKFLMIRDLFDGDGEEYERTLGELESFESFDDCLLYIAENHPEWNPDSEGAKFLTQLLERKLL
ncbi:MAG: hypothetical protein IKY82_05225 [Alistipes sp.]|nr:hypothetical protein [Alistipes sp.]